MSDNNSITVFLAVWGAVLSSITFAWNILRDISQRGRLRVTCFIGKLAYPGVGVDPKDYLVWEVVNRGKDPIVLTNIGGTNKGKTAFVVNTRSTLPVTLKQHERFSEYVDDLTILKDDLINLWAADSLGREWKIPRKQLRYLKRYLTKETNKV